MSDKNQPTTTKISRDGEEDRFHDDVLGESGPMTLLDSDSSEKKEKEGTNKLSSAKAKVRSVKKYLRRLSSAASGGDGADSINEENGPRVAGQTLRRLSLRTSSPSPSAEVKQPSRRRSSMTGLCDSGGEKWMGKFIRRLSSAGGDDDNDGGNEGSNMGSRAFRRLSLTPGSSIISAGNNIAAKAMRRLSSVGASSHGHSQQEIDVLDDDTMSSSFCEEFNSIPVPVISDKKQKKRRNSIELVANMFSGGVGGTRPLMPHRNSFDLYPVADDDHFDDFDAFLHEWLAEGEKENVEKEAHKRFADDFSGNTNKIQREQSRRRNSIHEIRPASFRGM